MSTQQRQPAIYIPHGGGPWPFVDMGVPRETLEPLARYLRQLVSGLPVRPRALLVVSAHWEERVPTLMTAPQPPMLYDYYGFPAESYTLQWPAPAAPDVSARARVLLDAAGFNTATDPVRGYDHGTFVPLMLAVPGADIPVAQVSLLSSLDATEHIALGRALAPLRDDGVLLIGSGNSYHNMRGFRRPTSEAPSRAFDDWLGRAVTQDAATRARLLADWAAAPAARDCHPREEHLLPLHVMAGASLGDAGTVPFRGFTMGVHVSAVQFG
jgi:aromatic ring-opening dioxygenase catalytic subunit (LigB family)